ncbi:MAG: four helix bundle protein [Bacteroidales bacterium]|nr:four helix bundle protein [Bacteroidales bacterium]MDZ4203801.1 four helix bundle protein [Bacteroidales bacterium]
MKSYKDLEIYNLALGLAIKIRLMSLKLPVPDRFEVGDQIRRSSQSIKDNIVEGYGRRRYKADFIKFLTYSHASLLEATSQAAFLHLAFPDSKWDEISIELESLGVKINNFTTYVETSWKTTRI